MTELRAPVAPAERCPRCSTERVAGDRYCENDGYDFDDRGVDVGIVGGGRRPPTGRATTSSRPTTSTSPTHVPTLTRALDADTVTVGRTSASRGIHPDIDLSGPPEDPGVSREHLRLERTADGALRGRRLRIGQRHDAERRPHAHPARDTGAALRR